MNPAARTVTVPLPGSREHEVPSLSLSPVSFCCQVSLRTCIKCLCASLSQRVAPLKLPVHKRWLEPLLASYLSTGAWCALDRACGSVSCRSTSAAPCSQSVHRLHHELHRWSLDGCTHVTTRCPHRESSLLSSKDLLRDRKSCKGYICCVVSGETGTVGDRSHGKVRPTQKRRQNAQGQTQQVVTEDMSSLFLLKED